MKSLVYVLVASLVLAGSAAATYDAAGADEEGETPYCSEGQSERVSNNPLVAGLRGAGVANACEGEHWEGGDYVRDNQGGCNEISPNTVAFEHCAGGNFDERSDAPGELGVRVSQGVRGAYVSLQIGGVGTAAVFTDGQTTSVFLQDYSDTLGVTCIVHPDEGCNSLAKVVHDLGITQGAVGEEDRASCTVTGYSTAGSCTRDNTAVSVVILP